MPFFFDYYYIILIIPALLISIWAQTKVNSAFNKYNKVFCGEGTRAEPHTYASSQFLFCHN